MIEALRTRKPARVAANLYNGLEAAARESAPNLARMRAALMAAGALGAAMSGSGPTVFGVARSFEQARQIRARLARGSWGCWAVRTVSGPAVRMRAADIRNGSWESDGAWPSGKARDFGSRIRRFESSRPNHMSRAALTRTMGGGR